MPLPGLLAYIAAEEARLRLRHQAEVVRRLEASTIDLTQPVQPVLVECQPAPICATAVEQILVPGPREETPAQVCALPTLQPVMPSSQLMPSAQLAEDEQASSCQSQSESSGSEFQPEDQPEDLDQGPTTRGRSLED